ncbi:hypothetical protein [Kitasatospora sp. NPDC057223]|uniref:hypothetical protein n=1 Tax=Kitasatospora sp. NPDC057223 TaxID=3346055 RepID=UPI003630580A
MDFDEIADQLYALAPTEFTPARDEAAQRARRAGDRPLAKKIRALRRPTTAAWLANRLTRTHHDETAALLELGRGLRAAQEHLAAPELRDLLAQRHQVVLALVGQARDDARNAGHHVGDGPAQELEETLQAALADPAAAAAFEAGRLTTALRPGAGITLPTTTDTNTGGEGDGPPPGRPTGSPAGRGATTRTGRTTAAGTTREADELARLEAEAADLTTQVEQAKKDARSAERKARSAQAHANRAQGALEDAEQAVQRAQAALEQAEAAQDTATGTARTRHEEAATATTKARDAASRTGELTTRLNSARERIAALGKSSSPT